MGNAQKAQHALGVFCLLLSAAQFALTEAQGAATAAHAQSRENQWTTAAAGWPDGSRPGFDSPAAAAAAGHQGSDAATSAQSGSYKNSFGGSLPLPGHSAPHLAANRRPPRGESNGADAVCSTGKRTAAAAAAAAAVVRSSFELEFAPWLRLAFDCALRRVVAFGVRDHLVDKYKLPMVPLDVCQSEVLLDVEQCIPVDFMDKFPSDTLIERESPEAGLGEWRAAQVVRQKQLLVGTMDFSVFPQLAADQGYTAGFYPELVQAVAQELTVIVLQNPGLRRELVGERELDISILNQSFSKRVQDIKAAVAQELLIGTACSEEANSPAGHGLQQVAAAGRGPIGHGEALGGEGNLPWQDTLVCGDVSGSASTCQLHGCLSPWGEVPKEFQIAVTHVKFSTPMNLVAAVHRGEVHMTDVGTIASAYLPEKYNFLPLREVLEPSCTVGAWKSFFLLRDPASRRRRGRRQASADPEQQNFARSAAGTSDKGGVNVLGSTLGWSGGVSGGRGSVGRNTSPGKSHPGGGGSKDISKDRRHQRPAGVSESTNLMNRMESWEERMRRTRSLFFKLYGVQTEAAATGNSQHASASVSPAGANSIGPSRSADTETAFEEKTLVKLQAVDHFLYSYLFPQEFRISSVRKLTDLSSVLSDGEPVGAFGTTELWSFQDPLCL
ncbi:hypothetical protein, conserved [Eimeria necatrix]|uniref:Uncharacterized protein n=1 Tax=Eimeria necatrix TaxID=51315 RepID=U6MVT3_9EIME|nr:hypothetical protein, conserved [Eimeria necatrix]CDJ65840.1 hypothetical protein, conserved [Eimeria necatrix]